MGKIGVSSGQKSTIERNVFKPRGLQQSYFHGIRYFVSTCYTSKQTTILQQYCVSLTGGITRIIDCLELTNEFESDTSRTKIFFYQIWLCYYTIFWYLRKVQERKLLSSSHDGSNNWAKLISSLYEIQFLENNIVSLKIFIQHKNIIKCIKCIKKINIA